MGQGKDTYKLIYEFNNDSSLFARLAASEIENKNYQNAIKILEKGIEKFPSYPSAYFIYSLALAHQGKINDAFSALEKVRAFFPYEESIDFYKNEIEKINRDLTSLRGSSRISFVPGNFESQRETFEDNLGSIAERLKNAKIEINHSIAGDITPKQEETPSRLIVSETMAQIFYNQGKLPEAILVFEELIETEPEREEYFKAKIEEIKKQINA